MKAVSLSLSDKGVLKRLDRNKYLFILLLPTLLYLFCFKIMPLYGITLAFKKFYYLKGIMESPWVGLQNFEKIFRQEHFWRAFFNTIIITGYRLVLEFPIPIILALLINEIKNKYFRKSLQVAFTFPHFLSWVIISGIVFNLFGEAGVVNKITALLHLPEANVLTNADVFRFFLTATNNWKEAGWNTIIYLAALAGVDPCLYEASAIDGANRWHKIRYIDWPAIMPTAIILLILFVGNTLSSGSGGFSQIFNLYNPGVFETGDIIDTYIYRQAFTIGRPFGEVTAIGLFKSVLNFILILSANKLAHVISNGEKGLF